MLFFYFYSVVQNLPAVCRRGREQTIGHTSPQSMSIFSPLLPGKTIKIISHYRLPGRYSQEIFFYFNTGRDKHLKLLTKVKNEIYPTNRVNKTIFAFINMPNTGTRYYSRSWHPTFNLKVVGGWGEDRHTQFICIFFFLFFLPTET